MMQRLRQWLSGLSAREIGLLSVLAGVAVPVGLVFAVALPVLEAHATATRAAATAQADLQWLRGQLADADAAGVLAIAGAPADAGSPAGAAESRPRGLAALERSLQDAGLRQQVDFIGNADSEGVRIEFRQVGFSDFMDWLGTVEAGFGYRIGALELNRGASPGMVATALLLVEAE